MTIVQGLRSSISWLSSASRTDGGTKSGLIVTPVAAPVIRYLNAFLVELATKGAEVTLRASQNLPALPGSGDGPPPFAQVVNRLKVLSGLDPVPYQRVVSGGFEHTVRDQGCRIEATFSDGGNEPWCRVAVVQGGAPRLQRNT